MIKIKTIALCMTAISLTACSSWMGDPETPPLPGTRLSVMQLQQKLEPDAGAAAAVFEAPTSHVNPVWPQAGGDAGHVMQHLALSSGALKKIWSADIGAGSTKTNPITAQPIMVGGRLFALDSAGQLTAFDHNSGKRLWRVDVGARDEDDAAIGGGLAGTDDMVFVTNGYAELVALNGADGSEIWRAKLPAPARAAPAVLEGRVYVITLDSRLLAFDAGQGQQIWSYRGIGSGAGLLGAAAPAVNQDIVMAPFSSGDLFALRTENGSVAWSDNLAPPLRLGGVAGLADIRALPVLDQGLVIAVSYSGRMVAIDERTGARIWQREIGGEETPVVAGSYIFVLTSDQQLISLVRETGAIRWITQLDRFKNATERTGPIVWTGPIYAGGRLMVAGTAGRVLNIDPATGTIETEWQMGGTPAVPLVVVDETLYTLTDQGTLSAWK